MMAALDLQPFKDVVGQRCGLTFDALSEAGLAAALAKRMQATGSATASGYFTFLIGDGGEFQELVALLTVNETYFFREPAQLTLLVDVLVPRLLIGRGAGRPVRILSAGCSTGEEPYSIAIALKEKFGESVGHLASIVAADIDHRALEVARRAEYGDYSFRALSPALRDRHFARGDGRRHLLHESVRSLVEFHSFNLLSPQYPEALFGFDVVFFRNVSIYFDAATRKAILANLHAIMTESGALILGASETLANDFGIFRLVEEGGGFYFAKAPVAGPAPRRPASVPAPPKVERVRPIERPTLPAHPALATLPPPVDWAATVTTVRALVREKSHPEALQAIQALPPGDIRSWLLEGHVLLHMRRFAEATAIAARAVDQDSWSIDAHMLLALAAKWQGDEAAAIDSLKVVVYSKPDCWPAHFYLATLLQGVDAAKARREYAVALRQIEADPDPDGGLWLPLDLPVADIRFLCQRRRAALDPADPAQGDGDRH